MDGRAGVSITNRISLLHNVKLVDAKFKSNICMNGATSKLIITPRAVEYTKVHALTRQGFIDDK